MQGDAYKNHRPKETFPLYSLTISGVCYSDNSSRFTSSTLTFVPSVTCLGFGSTYILTEGFGRRIPVPIIGLQWVTLTSVHQSLSHTGESFLKSSKYIGMKEPYIFPVVWSAAGRRRRGRFLFPNLACQGVSYLTPDTMVINNVIRCNL